jgi:hypothetical protein
MRFFKILLAASLLCGAMGWAQAAAGAPAANTQAINAQNQNNVCRIYFFTPKPDQVQQFETGRKKHNQFHRSQNDTFTWSTYVVETGDNTGRYVTSTCGHAWKDFDAWENKMGKADAADAAADLAPYVQAGSNGFYVYRADMSLAPPNRPPAPRVSVTIYQLKPGAGNDFIATVKKINDALSKQPDWPKTSGWLQLLNGGEGPVFVLLSDRQNWAGFEPLPKSVRDVLVETYGEDSANQVLKTIGDSTAHLWSEEALYRPDLSYVPTK